MKSEENTTVKSAKSLGSRFFKLHQHMQATVPSNQFTGMQGLYSGNTKSATLNNFMHKRSKQRHGGQTRDPKQNTMLSF